MSVRIRLRRVGRKKQPSYRLVVADSATPRDGAYLDTVGFYNPRTSPAQLSVDMEKVEFWLGRGADVTETVASLLRKARRGGDAKVALVQRAAPPEAEPAPAARRTKAGAAAPAEAEPAEGVPAAVPEEPAAGEAPAEQPGEAESPRGA
jgi:small subunit ribosomal protein S16